PICDPSRASLCHLSPSPASFTPPFAPPPPTITSAPLTPTPFPYTTLFRSPRSSPETIARSPTTTSGVAPRYRLRVAHQTGNRRIDRKSTRLNSSHVSISYAVFCLKKKKEGRDSVAVLELTFKMCCQGT